MPHYRQHISDLAFICKKKGIRKIVISPGSRSAPLIRAFFEEFGDACYSIVDERSAAYFALGMAIYSRIPVVLICTSGTAMLNYAPAIAEAYYQQVPLLVVTADRPHEWIDQQDNQALRQKDAYARFIRGSFEIPQALTTDDDVWFSQRIFNEAINTCKGPIPGPVHINVPLTEPLYDELPAPSENIRLIEPLNTGISLSLSDTTTETWKNARRIMIIHGQDNPGSGVGPLLKRLSADSRIIVFAENISNIYDRHIVSNSNLVLSTHRGNSPDYPDLILHSGGQVVSKALTGYLRHAGDIPCWRIGLDDNIIDTFKQVTGLFPFHAKQVYAAFLALNTPPVSSGYRESWLQAADESNTGLKNRISQLPFSDLTVFNRVLDSIPVETFVMLGNSSIIRYSQLFPAKEATLYFSNRGVSGIDGYISTSAGIATASEKTTFILAGDLGFLYDSNGLWNDALPAGLRILVINNGGGGIFHILKGPPQQPGFKQYIEANHPVNIHKLADAFGLRYFLAADDGAIIEQWQEFLNGKGAAVFEVKTDAESSAAVFRQIMEIPR